MAGHEVCVTCGHPRAAHIYEEGACRPGFECLLHCSEFKSHAPKAEVPMFTPYRIEWQGPEGTRVVLDEDGVTVRWPSRPGAIEECDVDRLLEVIAEAKRCKAAKGAPAPAVPDRNDWRRGNIREYQAKRIVTAAAIRNELGVDADAQPPF